MTTDPLHLAELLCARVCHDLSGPLGSMIGVTELAVDGSADVSEAIALAGEAAGVLGRRLRLMRVAWGGDATGMTVAQFQELAEGWALGRRVELDLTGLDPGPGFAASGARMALNALLLGIESLGGAGRVAVGGAANADVLITIDGPRAAWPAGFAACLADEQTAWQDLTSARTLQGPLTALIAHRTGVRLSLLLPTGASAVPPPLLLALAPPP